MPGIAGMEVIKLFHAVVQYRTDEDQERSDDLMLEIQTAVESLSDDALRSLNKLSLALLLSTERRPDDVPPPMPAPGPPDDDAPHEPGHEPPPDDDADEELPPEDAARK